MNWRLEDFVAPAVIIVPTAAGIALVRRTARSRAVRVALVIGIVAAAMAVWAQLAVGIL